MSALIGRRDFLFSFWISKRRKEAKEEKKPGEGFRFSLPWTLPFKNDHTGAAAPMWRTPGECPRGRKAVGAGLEPARNGNTRRSRNRLGGGLMEIRWFHGPPWAAARTALELNFRKFGGRVWNPPLRFLKQIFGNSEGRDWKGNRQGSPSDSIIRRRAAGRCGHRPLHVHCPKYVRRGPRPYGLPCRRSPGGNPDGGLASPPLVVSRGCPEGGNRNPPSGCFSLL